MPRQEWYNEYDDEDIKMEIHPVVKEVVNQTSMLNGRTVEEQTEFNSAKAAK